jgi:DNA-binding transcriptional regulator YiaG
MKNRKKTTFVFQGFGFPIKLIDVPIRKVLGHWVIDIEMGKLEIVVLQALIYRPTLLNGDELRFIRKYLSMTTSEFGKLFGVSHVAVVKWESGKTHTSPSTEICVRLHVLNHLRAMDKDFRHLYNTLGAGNLEKRKKEKIHQISINVSEELKSA